MARVLPRLCATLPRRLPVGANLLHQGWLVIRFILLLLLLFEVRWDVRLRLLCVLLRSLDVIGLVIVQAQLLHRAPHLVSLEELWIRAGHRLDLVLVAECWLRILLLGHLQLVVVVE